MIPKLQKEFQDYNKKSDYKIKYRKIKTGYSLYLEIQRKNNRQTINLEGLTITGKISKLNQDKLVLEKASESQDSYNRQLKFEGDKALTRQKAKNINVVEYFSSLKEDKKGNTKRNWNNALRHFKIFTKGFVKFENIDIVFCENFRKYLLNNVSQNTTCCYFSVWKRVLNLAVRRDFIDKNPAIFVKNTKPEVSREFLTVSDLKQLIETSYEIDYIRSAFLFSCFTGLRLSDVKNLKWNNIKERMLNIRQIKTREPLRIKLSESAMNILEIQDKYNSNNSERVFALLADNATNKHIKRWIKKAGIDKHITFHSGRHTFATLCLTYDIDLYTVSKLLGHNDIKHTQIYAKLIDKKRDAAIDNLPTL